jgi:hypothetical protein
MLDQQLLLHMQLVQDLLMMALVLIELDHLLQVVLVLSLDGQSQRMQLGLVQC